MSLTAGEQYLIELINRGRLDPAAEAARYNLDLNAGLAAGTIGTKALQVLAPDRALETAATRHSDWMVANDSFSHTGAGGSDAGARMQSAGYAFTGTWGWRENLAWIGSTGRIDMEASIAQHHEGLYRSEHHRVNTFAPEMHKIGIGQAGGSFTYQGIAYNSSMVTENFAVSGSDVFVTGVAYRDADQNDFYSMGEGQKSVWVRAEGSADYSAAAGGYAIKIGMQDDLLVKIGIGGTQLARLKVDTSDGNVKLDIVTQTDGSRILELSGNTNLKSGIADARLLGSDDLDLTGSRVSNELTGNNGNNALHGAGGNDHLYGGDGHDRLYGGSGKDHLYGGDGRDMLDGGTGKDRLYGGSGRDMLDGGTGKDRLYGGGGRDMLDGGTGKDRLYGGSGRDMLDGGTGDDVMTGGGGADRFVFSGGRDRITDFTDNVDSVLIRVDILDGPESVSNILSHGEIVNGDAVFDFGGGNILTIDDVSNLQILANDLQIL